MKSLAVLVALLSAACGESVSGPIEYRLEGGIGGDTSKLTVDDQTLVATVVDQDGATHTATLSAEVLADLQQRIEDANLPGLRPRYEDSGTRDGFAETISATVGGTAHTVTVDASIPDAQQPWGLPAATHALGKLMFDIETSNP